MDEKGKQSEPHSHFDVISSGLAIMSSDSTATLT